MSTLTPDERATRAAGPQQTLVSVSAGVSGSRVRVELLAQGPPERPVVRPMLLAAALRGARVALVPEGALLLAGDAVAIDIRVDAGLSLELVEPAGTVAFDMRGGAASWDVRVTLGTGARLVWHGEPFVVAAGARVRRTTSVELGDGAALALRETLVLGRHGEPAGALLQSTEVVDAAGEPLLVEELALDRSTAGMVLGGHRVLDTALVIGTDLPAAGPDRLDLECGGALLRRLANDAHEGLAAAQWHAAAAAVGT